MDDIAKEIIPINIEEELKNSYMEYAMSVIAVSYTHLTLPTKPKG